MFLKHTGYSRDDLRCKDSDSGVDSPGLDEQPVGQAADIRVEGGHKSVHDFDEGHLRSQSLWDVHVTGCTGYTNNNGIHSFLYYRLLTGELQADVARSDNSHILKNTNKEKK